MPMSGQWFGSTEIGVIGYTCERGCYHVTSGNCYLEVLDECRQTAGARHHRVDCAEHARPGRDPVHPYRCGESAACCLRDPCGVRAHPAGAAHIGRIADQLVTAAGTTSPYLVEEALLQAIRMRRPGTTLRCETAASRSLRNGPGRTRPKNETGAPKRFTSWWRRMSGLELIAVEWAPGRTLDRPRTKMRRVKDERS